MKIILESWRKFVKEEKVDPKWLSTLEITPIMSLTGFKKRDGKTLKDQKANGQNLVLMN